MDGSAAERRLQVEAKALLHSAPRRPSPLGRGRLVGVEHSP